MITAFAVAGLVLLAVASGLVLYRIFVGPSNLDRIIATDILLIIVIAGIGLDAAWHRRDTSLPLLFVLGLISFVGGVAVTRFLSREDDPNRPGSADADPGLSFPPPDSAGSAAPGAPMTEPGAGASDDGDDPGEAVDTQGTDLGEEKR
jgi:multicomponent Na+:H+ antiporter subunit F